MIGTRREYILAFVTMLVAILLVYLVAVMSHGEAPLPSVYETEPSAYDSRLTEIDKQALDRAYRNYRIQLFDSWMKDPSKQPERAIMGAEKARAVYIRVMTEIDKRPK